MDGNGKPQQMAAYGALGGSVAAAFVGYFVEAASFGDAERAVGGFLAGSAAFAVVMTVLVFAFRKPYRARIGSPAPILVFAFALPLVLAVLAAPGLLPLLRP